MVWIISAVIVFMVILLYGCVVSGAEADRNIKEIMKKSRRKE